MPAPTPKLVVTVDAVQFANRFQGAWSEEAEYVAGQIVEWEEGFYTAVEPSLNQEPSNTAYWKLLGGI